MKNLLLTIGLLFIYVASNAQVERSTFFGEWHMQDIAYENSSEREVVSKEKMKEDGIFWIMRFSDEKFFQASNYNSRLEAEEMEGTWKLEKKELLTIFIHRDGKKLPLQFYYEFKDDKMILERYDQLRTQRMIVTLIKQ